VLTSSIISEKKIIPFIKIGNKYILDNDIYDYLPILPDSVYLSIFFEKSFLFRDDIIYIPCLINSYNYKTYITGSYNFNSFTLNYNIFKAELRSLYACKIPVLNFLDFINISTVISFYKEYKEVLLYIYEKYKNVVDYEYKTKAFIISEYISNNKLSYASNFVRILFNPFTDYGRFGLNANSFNILSLPKDKRSQLEAPSDYQLFEYDYNAFEIRVLLSLLNINQPKGDLYEVLHDMSSDYRSRSQFKQFLISSIYSQNESKTLLFKLMKDRHFYEKYPIKNGFVTNVFGKTMDCDRYHLLSRILQSSAAYILYQQMYELILFIEKFNLNTKLLFCIHDSVCLAIHKDEKQHIDTFRQILSNVTIKELNYSSSFNIKIKHGKNYGDMKIYET